VTATGLLEQELPALLNIVANPVQDELEVRADSQKLNGKTLAVYSINGALMSTEKVSQSMMKIDVSRYAKGMYFISCGGTTLKFVKE
jgi:hypothetical protein